MPAYKIPCTFQMAGTYVIESANLREAIKKAEHISGLPAEQEYISDSLVLDDVDSIFEINDMEAPCLSKEDIIEELNKRTDPRIHESCVFNAETEDYSVHELVAVLRDYYNFIYEY